MKNMVREKISSMDMKFNLN